ncbi:MAG: hypothetical protein VW622_10520 [Opitutae bacterium]
MMKEFENRLITFTQAAHILGYKNYRSVLRLISEGHLKEYEIPHTKRRRLALMEVMKVAVPESIGGLAEENKPSLTRKR